MKPILAFLFAFWLAGSAWAIDYAAAMSQLFPPGTSPWTCGDTYASIQMLDATPKPSEAAVEAAWGTYQANRPAAIKAETKAIYDKVAQEQTLLRAVVAALLEEVNVLRAEQKLQTVGVAQIVFDPPSLAANAGATSGNLTVNGAAIGDAVLVTAPYSQAGAIVSAYVSAANTVQIRVFNASGGTLNLASGNWGVQVVRYVAGGLPARTPAQARAAIFGKVDE